MRRLILILAIAAGLAPSTWLREPWAPDRSAELAITALPFAADDAGNLRLAGAWRLDSPNEHFHGYSALAVLGDGRLLAASDRGRMLIFAPPGKRETAPVFDHFGGEDAFAKRFADIEALTRDPASGTIWAAYERGNMIRRYRPSLVPDGEVWPEEMRAWPSNGGPEAMVRLNDGRFIVLSERNSFGLIFTGDPVEGIRPVKFRFHGPEGFRPVDMAQLPDGRVLILLRAFDWGLPPRFRGKIILADPAVIVEDGVWSGEALTDLSPSLPADNYEGMAVQPTEGGGAIVWIISDDNEMRFQQTVLLKFLWNPNG